MWRRASQWLTSPLCLVPLSCLSLTLHHKVSEVTDPFTEAVTVHIRTNRESCATDEEESQQPEKAESHRSDPSNLPELNKSTGRVMKLCLTWICHWKSSRALSECERTSYGLTGTQKHLTVICTCSQQTNTPQKASSPRSDKDMQPSSASVQQQMTSTLLGLKCAGQQHKVTSNQWRPITDTCWSAGYFIMNILKAEITECLSDSSAH